MRIQNSKSKMSLRLAVALNFSFFIFNCQAQVPAPGNAGLMTTSPVATNLWNVTSQPARVYFITAQNSSATDLWLFMANTNSATVANNSAPSVAPVLVPAGKTGGHAFGPLGAPFSRGVTVGTSTTDRTLTNGAASFIITVIYDGRAN